MGSSSTASATRRHTYPLSAVFGDAALVKVPGVGWHYSLRINSVSAGWVGGFGIGGSNCSSCSSVMSSSAHSDISCYDSYSNSGAQTYHVSLDDAVDHNDYLGASPVGPLQRLHGLVLLSVDETGLLEERGWGILK